MNAVNGSVIIKIILNQWKNKELRKKGKYNKKKLRRKEWNKWKKNPTKWESILSGLIKQSKFGEFSEFKEIRELKFL